MVEDHVSVNRASWDEEASNRVEQARRLFGSEEHFWGIWSNPESELGLLPDVSGLDAVELGCGTAFLSAWLMRLGAKPVGLDVSTEQLATARRLQGEFGLRFPLVHADAERVPFADGSFDFAISEYGAAIWCDPYLWIPEAARILRPGGRLLFVVGASLMMLCFPTDDDSASADTTLHRNYFGMHRFEWHTEDGTVDGVEFHLGHGDMIRLLRSCGFEIEDLREIQAPTDGAAEFATDVPLEWARRWPSVEVWTSRKVG
ncbi:MAG: class I SAM-dependent methyltransferase [Actinomycetota bacterium]